MHLYSTFSVDPLNFSLGANLYPNYHFSRFCKRAMNPLLKPLMKFGTRAQIWDSLPRAKFCKNRIPGILLLGKFIPKIPIPVRPYL